MAYEKFNILNSTAVPLNIDNVDTDQIIPARFLKATERKGFGDNLFRDWRYNSDNTLVDSFPLNNKKYEGKILVAGKNFGCGSDKNSKNIFEINLEDQEFEIKSSGKKEKFKISTYKKSNMSNGFDDIDYLINKKDQISAFENKLRY